MQFGGVFKKNSLWVFFDRQVFKKNGGSEHALNVGFFRARSALQCANRCERRDLNWHHAADNSALQKGWGCSPALWNWWRRCPLPMHRGLAADSVMVAKDAGHPSLRKRCACYLVPQHLSVLSVEPGILPFSDRVRAVSGIEKNHRHRLKDCSLDDSGFSRVALCVA